MWYESWHTTTQVSVTAGIAAANSTYNSTVQNAAIYYHAWWNHTTGDINAVKIRIRKATAPASPTAATVHIGIYDNGNTINPLQAPSPGTLLTQDTISINTLASNSHLTLEIPLATAASVTRDNIYFLAVSTQLFQLANSIDYYGTDDFNDPQQHSWHWTQLNYDLSTGAGGLPPDPYNVGAQNIPEQASDPAAAMWFIVYGPQTQVGATQGPQGAQGDTGAQGAQGPQGDKGLAGNSSLWTYNNDIPINNGTAGDFMISLSTSSPVPMPSWDTTPPVGGSLRVQLNEIDAFGNNMNDWILSINPGDIIYIRQHDDNTNYAYYRVDSYFGTFPSSGQVYEVTHIESNSVGNGSNWDGNQFDVGFIPAGPAGPQGAQGVAASGGSIAGLNFTRLTTGAPDGWGSTNQTAMPPSNVFSWFGPTQSASSGGVHPLYTGGTHGQDLKNLMWGGPPSSFPSNVMTPPRFEIVPGGVGATMKQISFPQMWNDAAWYVMPTSGTIIGYSVNLIHPYNSGVIFNTARELPVYCGVASWVAGPNYYEYSLTGSLETGGGLTGPAAEAGTEMFALTAVGTPPGTNQTESHQLKFVEGNLLVAGIGFGEFSTGAQDYPIDSMMYITVYVRFD